MLLPIVMAGGSGTRLWPLSREHYPKQFLMVSNELTMLQHTFARLGGIEHQPPLVICNEEHRFIAAEQIRQAGFEHSGIILEPMGKNTAPAIALAAMKSTLSNIASLPMDPLKTEKSKSVEPEERILLVLPADHRIENPSVFQSCIERALPYAQAGRLVSLGVFPTSAETGYGYIKKGAPQQIGNDASGGYDVAAFIEKPDLNRAQQYLSSGDYFWNSGIFMFKASRYLEELHRFAPDILTSCEKAFKAASSDMDFVRIDRGLFDLCPSDSIDYAVMEKTESATVIPMDAGWSDVGSWSALWDACEKDENNNVATGDVISIQSTGNYLHSENKLIAAVGVDDLIIVETKDAILVANKAEVQQVSSVVNQLKHANRSEHRNHREVYRPWGKYDVVDSGRHDQVKRITVKPGEKLLLQIHHHRAEHWIVVSGTAKVTCGEHTFFVFENQSTYIPFDTVHALENPGSTPLEMIEVQTGEYLSEEDVIRFEQRKGFAEEKV